MSKEKLTQGVIGILTSGDDVVFLPLPEEDYLSEADGGKGKKERGEEDHPIWTSLKAGMLGFVSGKVKTDQNLKNISEEEAMDVIFGYMILNDVSARDIQEMDKQFTRAKSFDTFAPCGPWITTKDEIDDPHNLKLLTKVNGTVRQDSTTSNMFIKIPSIISILSESMTLEPGDIISTGTAAGVALNNPNIPYLKDEDVIEMEIEKLGSIKNTVKFVD